MPGVSVWSWRQFHWLNRLSMKSRVNGHQCSIYIYTHLFIKFIKMIQDVCVFGSQVLLITTVGQVSPRLV